MFQPTHVVIKPQKEMFKFPQGTLLINVFDRYYKDANGNTRWLEDEFVKRIEDNV